MKTFILAMVLLSTLNTYGQWNTNHPHIHNTNSGFVGIGTTSPRAPLEVVVAGNNISSQQGLIIQQTNPGSPNNKAGVSLDFGIGNNGFNNNIVASMMVRETYWGGRPKMIFSLWDQDNMMRDRLAIDTYGKVGIGTILPRAALEVVVAGDNASPQQGLIIQQTNPGSPNNSAGVSLDFGIGNNWIHNNIMARMTVKETYWGTQPKMIFSLWDQNNVMQDRLAIDTYGRVGIGTSDPDAQLAVKGDIHTREVRVDMNGSAGPDYVFDDTYDLSSLETVEAYIKEHKHLPEVPSAKEMDENGLNLKEMNLLLLKKIEELTLYIIQQNKKIAELEKQNLTLSQQSEDFKSLKAMLEELLERQKKE
jgi:hypothetical protein